MGRKPKSTIVEIKEQTPSIISSISQQPLEVQEAARELIATACKRIGMGLDDYLLAIKRGLIAKKEGKTEYRDGIPTEIDGMDDHLVQLKASALGLEVEGYLRAKGIETAGNMAVLGDVKILIQEWKTIA